MQVQGSGFRVQGLGFRVRGFGFRVLGFGFLGLGFWTVAASVVDLHSTTQTAQTLNPKSLSPS